MFGQLLEINLSQVSHPIASKATFEARAWGCQAPVKRGFANHDLPEASCGFSARKEAFFGIPRPEANSTIVSSKMLSSEAEMKHDKTIPICFFAEFRFMLAKLLRSRLQQALVSDLTNVLICSGLSWCTFKAGCLRILKACV